MNRQILCAMLLSTAFASRGVSAQSAIDEAGEPRATTSPAAPPAAPPKAPPAGAPPAGAPQPAVAKAPGKPVSIEPRAGKTATGRVPAERVAADRVELDTTTVTGNRELPKVMYVVPWKRSDIGDLIGRPANSLLDEVLAPVDRTVFRREVQYYQALKPDTSAPQNVTDASSTVPVAPGEK